MGALSLMTILSFVIGWIFHSVPAQFQTSKLEFFTSPILNRVSLYALWWFECDTKHELYGGKCKDNEMREGTHAWDVLYFCQ